MKKNVIKFVIFFFLSGLLIVIDQMTKSIAFKTLYGKEPIVLIENVLELVYVENRGAAFGILQNQYQLFYILTVIVLFAVIIYVYKMKLDYSNVLYFVFFILIFSGAIGNFIDRVKNKYVIDFIYFKPIDFPVFNFADICITIGCVLLLYLIVFARNGDDIGI